MVTMNSSDPKLPARRKNAKQKVSVIGLLLFLIDLAQINFNLPTTNHETLVYSMTRKLTAVDSNASSTTKTTTSTDTIPRILLITFVFGDKVAHKKSLRMFVESARRSGVDLAIVGSPTVPFLEELPPNVKHLNITWEDMVKTRGVQQAVLDGGRDLLTQNVQTTVDRDAVLDDGKQPLLGHLFPGLTADYDWWGYVDHDLVLGNLRTFLTPTLLQENDILCAMDDCRARGPLSLYKNTAAVNKLLLDTTASQFLNVWGHYGVPGDKQVNPRKLYHPSMVKIVKQHADALGLKWRGAVVPLGHIGPCNSNNGIQFLGDDDDDNTNTNSCTECHLIRSPNGLQRLTAISSPYNCQRENCEVGLCELNTVQHATLESSLSDPTITNLMIQQGQFRVSFEQGFQASSLSSQKAKPTS